MGRKKGFKLSEEHKRKIGLANTNPPPETILKRSNSMKGKKLSEETKMKISKTSIGRKHSEETKRLIGFFSKGNKHGLGYKHSDKSKKQMASSRKGHKHSEETKRKIGLANSGVIMKEEVKEKIRIARSKQIFPKNDTKIEIKIQNFLSQLHIRYITHKYISEITDKYRCDIFIPEQKGILQKTIIECDGCFFHACLICKNKKYFWTIKRRELDKKRTEQLQQQGFRVIRLWEHVINGMGLNDFEKRINLKVIKLQ